MNKALLFTLFAAWTFLACVPAVTAGPSNDLDAILAAPAVRGDDERLRSEEPFQTQIGNTLLTISGELNMDVRGQKNLNLQSRKNRDRLRLREQMDVDINLLFPQGTSFFSEFRIEKKSTFEPEEQPENEFELRVKEAFMEVPLPFPVTSTLRIGRQQFFESRRWVFNDELDAVRLFLDPDPVHLSLSVSTPVPNSDDLVHIFDDVIVNRDQVDFSVEASYAPKGKPRLGTYLIVRDDDSPRDEDPIFFGLRSSGKLKVRLGKPKYMRGKIRYWFDGAGVAGTVGSKEISGFAVDAGASYSLYKLKFEPYLIMGYAFGSGDRNPDDAVDRSYRQTGFQSNKAKLGGVVNYEYYGVLFDPELSNINIMTAGIGMRPTHRSSIDLVYHHYRQQHAANTIRRDGLKAEPVGLNPNLGDEIDLVLGYRELKNLRFRLRAGYFFPGPAFGPMSDPAFEGRLDIQYSF